MLKELSSFALLVAMACFVLFYILPLSLDKEAKRQQEVQHSLYVQGYIK